MAFGRLLATALVVTACSSPPAPDAVEAPPLLPGAPRLHAATLAPSARLVGPIGFDVSYPQCGRALPTSAGFGIVGITGGRPKRTQRCLDTQLGWAVRLAAYAVYVNTAFDRSVDPVTAGGEIARDALAREHASGAGVPMWWLDVETVNEWRGTAQENATVLDALAVALQDAGARVGIYSTPTMWESIAGDWRPGLPVWLATGPGTQARALAQCDRELAGEQPSIVQWVQDTSRGKLDHDALCPSERRHAADVLVINRSAK